MTRRLTIALATIVSLLVAACSGDQTASTTTSPAVDETTSSVADTTTTSLEPTTTVEEAMDDDNADGGDPEITPEIAADLAQIRAGTAQYVNDLDSAAEDGFFIITQMIPDMGYHFLNPNVEGFDIGQPPILVYGRDGDEWELGAVEWVFPEEPAEPPMEGGTYGAFPAACHYDDGLFVPTATEEECAEAHPETEAAFTFWHPDLVTFHVWAWMHNPDGIYNGTNPLMSARNEG
ncbi:MAG TPA: hypothetical protein VGC03_17410 [Acidimicrobiia bacterium]|jgi:hypothetical protein